MNNLLALCGEYLFVAATSSLSIVICLLLGLLCVRILRQEGNIQGWQYLHSLWLGYVVLISLIMLINLFLPITQLSTLPIVFALCVLSIYLNRRLIYTVCKFIASHKVNIVLTIIALNIVTLIFFKSRFEYGYSFDTFNYHFYMLRLLGDYPAIRGLINIFPHAANSYATIYHAGFIKLFTVGDSFAPYLFFAAGNTIVLGLFISLIAFVQEYFNKKISGFTQQFFRRFYFVSFLIIVAVVIETITDGSTILEGLIFFIPDIAYYFVNFLCLVYLLRYLEERSSANLLWFFSIATVALLIKLSSLGFIALTLVFVIYATQKYARQNWCSMGTIVTLLFLLFVPYFVQSIIRSGALAFPLAITDLGLAWSNKEELRAYSAGVLSWSRTYGQLAGGAFVFSDFAWVKTWLGIYKHLFLMFGKIYAVLLLLFFVVLWRFKNAKAINYKILGIAFAAWLLWFVWFFLAGPNVRFAGVLFLFPIFILVTLISLQIELPKITHVKFVYFTLCLALIFATTDVVKLYHRIGMTVVSNDAVFVRHEYDSVLTYEAQWDWAGVAGYTKLAPMVEVHSDTSLDRYSQFEWIDKTKWWKGTLHKK